MGEIAKVIHHDTRQLLHRWQWPIRASYRLKQIVIAKWFVQIHNLLHRRIEARQQSIAHDQNLERRLPSSLIVAELFAIPPLPFLGRELEVINQVILSIFVIL